MQLDIPDEIVHQAEADTAELRMLLAIQLYADNRIDHRCACRLSGLSADVLNRELIRRQMVIQQYPEAGDTLHREAG